MFRIKPALIPALAAALIAATTLAPAPATADAGAQVRAMVAEITGRPVRHVQPMTAVRTSRHARFVYSDDAEALMRFTIHRPPARSLANLAPAVSPRPLARPARLALAFASCNGLLGVGVLRVCVRPLANAAPLRLVAELPAAASGQMVVITDGRVRHYSLMR